MPEKQSPHILMDHNRVIRTLRRMAFQIAESLAAPENLIIAGLNQRGYDTARLLSELFPGQTERRIPVVRLDVDGEESPKLDMDTNGKCVLLVDDVLFSGRTMLRALDSAGNSGSPEWIKIAVLVDRGHRKFPLYPEFSGIRYPTKFREHVKVETNEGENFRVMLLPDREQQVD